MPGGANGIKWKIFIMARLIFGETRRLPDMTWVVSNGDLAKVPQLNIGQEVLSCVYQDGYILTGPSQYETSQVLNNSDIVHFETVIQVQTFGPGIYEESMMLKSAGAAVAGVTCGVDWLDTEGANFAATPYGETVITRSRFMADDLTYCSVGSVDQADLEMQDSFGLVIIRPGPGFG